MRNRLQNYEAFEESLPRKCPQKEKMLVTRAVTAACSDAEPRAWMSCSSFSLILMEPLNNQTRPIDHLVRMQGTCNVIVPCFSLRPYLQNRTQPFNTSNWALANTLPLNVVRQKTSVKSLIYHG